MKRSKLKNIPSHFAAVIVISKEDSCTTEEIYKILKTDAEKLCHYLDEITKQKEETK